MDDEMVDEEIFDLPNEWCLECQGGVELDTERGGEISLLIVVPEGTPDPSQYTIPMARLHADCSENPLEFMDEPAANTEPTQICPVCLLPRTGHYEQVPRDYPGTPGYYFAVHRECLEGKIDWRVSQLATNFLDSVIGYSGDYI